MTQRSFPHEPVLVEEVITYLALHPGARVADATAGAGGHGEAICKVLGERGGYVGLDVDPEILDVARARLVPYGSVARLVCASYARLRDVWKELALPSPQAVLFDLGASSLQLDDARRGFSFLKDGPLDMRMDPSLPRTATDLVNEISEVELARLIAELGEDRYADRIARAICRARSRCPLKRTAELADIITGAVPRWSGRIHPATRTFQALRMAVNDELHNLQQGLEMAIDLLAPSGRVAVIAFHSLEDRIVKNVFVEKAGAGCLRVITRKPVRPAKREVARNRRARSARLRVAERVSGEENR